MTANPDESLFASITSLSKLSDDELYEELSNAVLGSGLGVGPSDRDGRQRFGRQWFAGRLDEFKRLICTKESVREVRGLAHDDQFLAVATVADALIHAIGQPAAVVVSILVVRLGLDGFCEGYS
jgi:hypothetical protein